MKLKNKRILITGGAGFIGSHLVDKLVSLENEIVIVDNLSSGKMDFLTESKEKIEVQNVDLLKIDALLPILKGCDAVFHLAANPMVKISEDQTRLHIDHNIMLTYNVLEAMRKLDVKDLAFASTSTVYGEPTVIPTPEDYGPLLPISLYGASKLACEALISAFCSSFDMHAVMYRFANVIGSRSTHGVIFDFVNKLNKNPQALEILGREPGTKKSYIHISDCVDGMVFACENTQENVGVFNIGSEDAVDVKTIANSVCKEMGLENVNYQWTGGVDDGRGWRGDIKVMVLSIEKMKALGWKPKYGSEKAVRLTAEVLVKG